MKNKPTYRDMADRAADDSAIELAFVLLRIYEADRTGNNGTVMGEAVLSRSFSGEARHVLIKAGVLEAGS